MEPLAAGPNEPYDLKELGVDSWSHLNSDKPIPKSHVVRIGKFKHVLEETPTTKFIADSFKVTVGGIESHWEFRVYPNGYDEENKSYLGIFVKHKETEHKSGRSQTQGDRPEYLIKSVIQLLDYRKGKVTKVDLPAKILSSKQMHGTKKYIEKETLLSDPNMYYDDSITFLLEAEICLPKTKTTSEDFIEVDKSLIAQKSQLASHKTMSSNFTGLMEMGSFSDVKIKCEGREFSCHKAILSCRSTVFHAMFQHLKMKENEMNVVDIEDLSSSTVDRMLKYVYSGKLIDGGQDNELLSTADKYDQDYELLAAADKYDLTDLKVSCERSLSSSLNNHNCVNLLILADRHTAISLRKSAMSFVLGNLSAVVKVADWHKKLTPYPDIMAQIIQEMSKDGQPKTKRRKKESVVVDDTESDSDVFENARNHHH